VIVACNYTRLLGEFSVGCLAPFGFLGCQQIWNTPRAYGSCGIQNLITTNNYQLNYVTDIVQNGGPNCLADPPGHSLLSTYQRAKNAATLFAPMILENSSCLITGIENQQPNNFILPNPTENSFSIKALQRPVSLQIFNIQGRLVYSASSSECQSNLFPIRHLDTGIYQVVLQLENGTMSTQKLLKISQ
jgi:hypothetical protein